MPTSATGTCNSAPATAARGFSLIELLVVVLLIGIILSMATLAVGPGLRRDAGAAAADRLHAVLVLAREQAILQGVEHGVAFGTDGYRVLALDGDAWLPLDDDPAWRPRPLPDTLALHLVSDGREVELPPEAGLTPQVLLFSSGETTPFVIELSAPQRVCRLAADGVNPPAAPICEAA